MYVKRSCTLNVHNALVRERPQIDARGASCGRSRLTRRYENCRLRMSLLVSGYPNGPWRSTLCGPFLVWSPSNGRADRIAHQFRAKRKVELPQVAKRIGGNLFVDTRCSASKSKAFAFDPFGNQGRLPLGGAEVSESLNQDGSP